MVLFLAISLGIVLLATTYIGKAGKLEKGDFQNAEIVPSSDCNASNQQRDSNGWIIYENDSQKFIIKYPSNWLTSKSVSCWINIINTQPLYRKGEIDPVYFEGYKTITMYQVNLTTQNVNQFFNDLGTERGVNSDLYYPATIENFYFKGYPAKRVKGVTSGKNWTKEYIVILTGNKIYQISIIPYGGSKDPEIKSILNTIEFLD